MERSGPTPGQASQRLGGRRAELSASLGEVEQAVAAAGPEDSWVEGLAVALIGLVADFRKHIDTAGGSEGMSHTVVTAAPRLSHAVDDLTRERLEMLGLIESLLAAVRAPDAAVSVDQLRRRGVALLERLAGYRQRGSDLLHEADQDDVGGES
jgi:hypothetical protein